MIDSLVRVSRRDEEVDFVYVMLLSLMIQREQHHKHLSYDLNPSQQ